MHVLYQQGAQELKRTEPSAATGWAEEGVQRPRWRRWLGSERARAVLIPGVLEQLESVRRTRAEVLDIPTVRHVAMETEKPALVLWIDKHEQEYGQGLLHGFRTEG